MNNQPDEIVDKILKSVKYREISPTLIHHLVKREIDVRKNVKDTIKAVKKKLHQVCGAYLNIDMPYEGWAADLDSCEDREALKKTSLNIMRHHASTRERLGHFESMYQDLFDIIGPIKSMLDLGCGLNPLSVLWMQNVTGLRYDACDIYADQVKFLNHFFKVARIDGHARVYDISGGPPPSNVDVVLLLKILPLLRHMRGVDAPDFIKQLRARHVVVSYPSASLGGQDKGMEGHYAAEFEKMAVRESWEVENIRYDAELVYIIRLPRT